MTSFKKVNPLPGSDWTELYEQLRQEAEQQEALAERLAQKNELLVAGQVEALLKLDRELMAEGRKARVLAGRRQELMARMGCPDAPLSRLISRLDGEASARFSGMRDRLRLAVRTVEQRNQDNRDLLALSLNWLQETVNIIANAVAPEGACYTAQGGLPVSDPPNAPVHSTMSRSV